MEPVGLCDLAYLNLSFRWYGMGVFSGLIPGLRVTRELIFRKDGLIRCCCRSYLLFVYLAVMDTKGLRIQPDY